MDISDSKVDEEKIIKVDNFSSRETEQSILKWKYINHPFIIKCIDLHRRDNLVYAIYQPHIDENAINDINTLISQLNSENDKENFILELIYKLVLVMNYLYAINIHANKIEFRFIKRSQSIDDILVYIEDLDDLNKTNKARFSLDLKGILNEIFDKIFQVNFNMSLAEIEKLNENRFSRLLKKINAANEKEWGKFTYEFMMMMKPLEEKWFKDINIRSIGAKYNSTSHYYIKLAFVRETKTYKRYIVSNDENSRLIMDEYSIGHSTSLLFTNKNQTFITLKEIQTNKNIEYINFYLDCFNNPERFCLIKKYHHKTLRDYLEIKQKLNEQIEPQRIREWMLDLCESVNFLHKNNIIHRNIIPENIQIRNDGRLVLDSIETSSMFGDGVLSLIKKKYTCFYRDKDAITNKFTSNSDLWAIGCILYELIFLEKLFDAGGKNQTEKKVLKYKNEDLNEKLRNLIDNYKGFEGFLRRFLHVTTEQINLDELIQEITLKELD